MLVLDAEKQLNSNRFSPEGVELLAAALPSLPKLTHLL
jgi:hypothetical protein